MSTRFSDQGQPIQIVFVEESSKKGQDLKLLMQGTLSFNPNFEKGEKISLQQIGEGSDFTAASTDPEKLITHQVVETQWSFADLKGSMVSALMVIVKPIEKKVPTLLPPAFFSGGERRNNRF